MRVDIQLFLSNFFGVATKMTVMKYQNDRCSKWPLSKMTVNLAPKWPLYQNDRYFTLKWPLFRTKWPLFCTKWPLFFVFSTTVILDILKWPLIWKNLDQIDRYFKPKWPFNYQNDRSLPKWPLFKPKMTVVVSQNDRYISKSN